MFKIKYALNIGSRLRTFALAICYTFSLDNHGPHYFTSFKSAPISRSCEVNSNYPIQEHSHLPLNTLKFPYSALIFSKFVISQKYYITYSLTTFIFVSIKWI